jgi:hypothetical protein
MKTERDIILLIVELENWISQIKRENPIEGANAILIANEKINVLKWVLDDI